MTVVPAQLEQSVLESVEEFVEVNWFLWYAGIQPLAYLARAGRGIYTPVSNRAEVLRHELDGGLGPGSDLLWGRIEQLSERQIFRVVNHISMRRLAPILIWRTASES